MIRKALLLLLLVMFAFGCAGKSVVKPMFEDYAYAQCAYKIEAIDTDNDGEADEVVIYVMKQKRGEEKPTLIEVERRAMTDKEKEYVKEAIKAKAAGAQ
jgi:hypothetical protein